jgi:hypothetical protein
LTHMPTHSENRPLGRLSTLEPGPTSRVVLGSRTAPSGTGVPATIRLSVATGAPAPATLPPLAPAPQPRLPAVRHPAIPPARVAAADPPNSSRRESVFAPLSA